MINFLIKKLRGITQKELYKELEKIKNQDILDKAYCLLREKVKVSVRGDVPDTIKNLNAQGGFIDYLCVQLGMPKIYNNGCYEEFYDR